MREARFLTAFALSMLLAACGQSSEQDVRVAEPPTGRLERPLTSTLAMKLQQGAVQGVGNAQWQTVALGQVYTQMVVVTTPIYDVNVSPPLVTRVRNAAGSSFDIKVDRFDGQSAAVAPIAVQYVVLEAGAYTRAVHGVTLEAAVYTSTVTDRKGSWLGQARSYLNSYSSPVVLGQVQSVNDARPSVFWSRGGTKAQPPTSTRLFTGKHVGQDGVQTRQNEQIGYIVIEAGRGSLGGFALEAGVGADSVRGLGSPAQLYPLAAAGPTSSSVAIQTAMDGNEGSWAVLNGIDATGLRLHVDEDQITGSDRSHTNEQVAYLAFDQCPAGSAGQACNDGVCNAAGRCVECIAASDCDDANACTVDTCDPLSGCANAPSEGLGCAGGVCNAGGACVECLSDAQCADGNACNGVETCDAAGACRAGAPLDCDDGNACTADSCVMSIGCLNAVLDGDADGVCDAVDACPGYDDGVDGDADGAADGCDICPLDNPNDADGDAICNSDDECPGFDDALDADGDGAADGCDVCPGHNDGVDLDGDGIPDGCDDPEPSSCRPGATGAGILDVANYSITGTTAAAKIAALNGVWCVTGSLVIYNTTLSSLAGLEDLVAVGGSLEIGSYGLSKGNSNLSALTGLENLRHVGDQLRLYKNTVLTDASALGNLTHARSIWLNDHPALSDVSFLHDITEVEGFLKLEKMSLSDLSALASLTHVGQSLSFQDLSGITDATGLEALTSIGGNIVFSGAPSLVSLAGLENLESLGSLSLSGVPQLTDISALSGLTSIDRSIHIINTGLSDLAPITGAAAALSEHLNVLDNPQLDSLDGLQGLASITQTANIENNPSLTSISALSDVTQVGSSLSLINNGALTSLSGLQSLQVLGGALRISGNTSLTSLSALATLQSVGGSIDVWGNSIETLDGLQGVTSIGGGISITGDSLTSLAGFPSVVALPGSLGLWSLPRIHDLGPLSALTSIGGTLDLSAMDSVASLAPLAALSSVGGIRLSGNRLLVNLQGLSGITRLAELDIQGSPLLSLGGLENLTTVDHRLSIRSNQALYDISALSQLTSAGDLSIGDNANLPQCAVDLVAAAVGSSCESCWANAGTGACDGTPPPSVVCEPGASGPTVFEGTLDAANEWELRRLWGIECVTGSVVIYGDVGVNLGGLQRLTHVLGSFELRSNQLRSSLGLTRLETVGLEFRVRGNPLLEALAIPTLSSIGRGIPPEWLPSALDISDNPNLSQCYVDAIESQTALTCEACENNGPSCL